MPGRLKCNSNVQSFEQRGNGNRIFLLTLPNGEKKALSIFNVFKWQQTERVMNIIESNSCMVVRVFSAIRS